MFVEFGGLHLGALLACKSVELSKKCDVVLHLSRVWWIDVGHEPHIHTCENDVAYSR